MNKFRFENFTAKTYLKIGISVMLRRVERTFNLHRMEMMTHGQYISFQTFQFVVDHVVEGDLQFIEVRDDG